MSNTPLFHLAFPVRDIAEPRAFYGGLLGCPEGRSSEAWVDFNFYGHQLVAHLSPDECHAAATGQVDGDAVPNDHAGWLGRHSDLGRVARESAEGHPGRLRDSTFFRLAPEDLDDQRVAVALDHSELLAFVQRQTIVSFTIGGDVE